MTKSSDDKNNKTKTKNKKTEQNTKAKKRSKHPVAKRVFLTILIIIVVLFVYFFSKVMINGGGLGGIVKTVVGTSNSEIKNLPDIYTLLIGESQGMTDTIMVAKYNPRDQKAAVISVPRDSFVGKSEATASAYDKINARYSEGPQSLLDCVNDLTGLNVKYYINVDTKALRDLVDTLGGVYYDVPMDMDYDDSTQDLAIHLKAGYQLLNGQQAEGLVRFRHNNDGSSYPISYGDNDIGRMRTQRSFIKVVLKQAMKPENITKINQLMTIAQEEVDTNIPWNVSKNYIAALMDFNTDNMISDTLPGAPQYINSYSFYLVSKPQTKQLVQKMFLSTVETVQDDQTSENTTENETANSTTNKTAKNTIKVDETNYVSTYGVVEKNISIEVLNGTGSTEKYNDAIAQLKNQGYKVTKKGTTNITQKTTIINRTSQSSQVDNAIKSLLCTGDVEVGENTKKVDYTIILGLDY